MRNGLLVFWLFHLLFSSLLDAAEVRATAVLLDISKSVAPEDLQKAKAAIRDMAARTQPTDVLYVYVFGNKSKKIGPEQINAVEATESYTMLYDAVYDAVRDLAPVSAERKAVLIFSDGHDTRSVTILEDIVGYAKQERIPVYGVGIGKADRKVLERMAKLTGGSFFEVGESDLVNRISTAISQQEAVEAEPPSSQKPVQVAKPPVLSPVARPVVPVAPSAKPRTSVPYLWIAAIVGTVLLLGVVIAILRRRPDVISDTRILPPMEATVGAEDTPDITAAGEEEHPIHEEWREKLETTQEILSKTYVLIETPVLVVKKGKNLGDSFTLKQDVPVSIGRSRLNEIRLEDESVSGQHCQIIPEGGRHVIHDLESTNGTFVNETRVRQALLKDGDTITVGQTQFVYRIKQTRS